MIKERRVSFEHDDHVELVLVPGGEPGAPVSQRVGPLLVGYALGLFHSLTDLKIPFLACGYNPRFFPERKLLGICAGFVSARNE